MCRVGGEHNNRLESALDHGLAHIFCVERLTDSHIACSFTKKEDWCCHAACLFSRFASSCVYYGVSYNIKNLAGDRYLNVFLSGLVEIPSLIFVLLVNNRYVTICWIMIHSEYIPNTFICLCHGSLASNGTSSVNLHSVLDTIVLYKVSKPTTTDLDCCLGFLSLD